MAAAAFGWFAARDAPLAYVREHHQLDHPIIRRICRPESLAQVSWSVASGVKDLDLSQQRERRAAYSLDLAERAVRSPPASAFRATLVGHSNAGKGGASGEAAARLAQYWLLHARAQRRRRPLVLEPLAASMRAARCSMTPAPTAPTRARALKGDSAALVLRSISPRTRFAAYIA